MFKARFIHDGDAIDHTPSAPGGDVGAGDVIVQGDLVGIAKLNIPPGQLGALAVTGVFDVVKATGAIDVGVNVYWDADGDPIDGTPGSGAATTTATDNTLMGKSVRAAGENDATVRVRLTQ